MDKTLTIIFFEDYLVCSILPNESAWETIRVNGSDKMLLYFYVSGGDIRNDDFAKERFEANDTNAYGNFYETILAKGRTFRKYDLELQPIQLLRDTIEQIKASYFDRIKNFINDIDTTEEIPLNLCFIPGITRNARDLITNYFSQEGFVINSKADYFEAFLKILQRKGIITSKINLSIVESYFGDLLFYYIEYNEKIVKIETEKLIGKGVDYRIGNLAKLIVEKAAKKTSSQVLNDKDLFEQEIKTFHRRAALEIDKFEYNELDIKIELSDFSSARVIIDQRELEKMSSESFKFIEFRFGSFINKYSHPARIEKIFLNGDVLSSETFVQFFQKTFGSNKVVKPYDIFIELLSRGMFANAPTSEDQLLIPIEGIVKSDYNLTENPESIIQLLSKIELVMKSKKDLENEVNNLTKDINLLQNKKATLEKLKLDLETNIALLAKEVDSLKKATPPKKKVESDDKDDMFFKTPIKKDQKEKRIEDKSKSNDDFFK